MDASGTTEEELLLRMRKNAVDYDASPGLYDGGRLVGFTLIGIDRWGDRPTAYDAGTGIVPEFRNKGWAPRMLVHALPGLRERGLERFVLEVLQQNEPAIKAYRKSGFEVARALRSYVGDVTGFRAADRSGTFEVRRVDRPTLGALEAAADCVPSFENRFSAIDAIAEHVRLLGAFDGGTCVGALAYSPSLNWLLTILVAREHRRRGIGRALLGYLATTLPHSAARLAALNVDGDDTGMQAFFQSLGFAHLVDQYEMVRDL